MKAIHMIAHILLWIGGINWGLIGLYMVLYNGAMGWNVVDMLLGQWPTVEGIVYVLVGLSAIWALVGHRKDCRMCSSM